MELEEYSARIRALPVEQQHTLAEADPELAEAWAAADEARAEAWAAAHGVRIDERAKAELLERLMGRLRQEGRRPPDRQETTRSSQ